MVWRQPGDKPLSEPRMQGRIYASLGLNELISLHSWDYIARNLARAGPTVPLSCQWSVAQQRDSRPGYSQPCNGNTLVQVVLYRV